MNSTCFQDAIGLIQISISPGFLRLLNKMDKDLLRKIFVPLRGIKQEVYVVVQFYIWYNLFLNQYKLFELV